MGETRSQTKLCKFFSFLSRISFIYVVPFFIKGIRKRFKDKDITLSSEKYSSRRLGEKLEAAWNAEKNLKKTPSFYNAIINVFGLEVLLIGCVTLTFEVLLKILNTLLLTQVLYSIREKYEKNILYLYAGAYFLSGLLLILLRHNFYFLLELTGTKLRISVWSVLYKKFLRMDVSVFRKKTITDLMNLVSFDAFICSRAFLTVHYVWIPFVEIVIVYYILSSEVGYHSTLGIYLIIIFLPLQFCLVQIGTLAKLKMLLRADDRIRTMKYIITKIEMIKMCTYEKHLMNMVSFLRRRENQKTETVVFCELFVTSFSLFASRTAQSISIIAIALIKNDLDPFYVFSVVAFYNLLCTSVFLRFPVGVKGLLELQLSAAGIQTFLMYKDTEKTGRSRGQSFTLVLDDLDEDAVSVKVALRNVSAKWSKSSDIHIINNVTVELCAKQISALVGPVGSGKTSLLNVINRELPITDGSIKVDGSISFLPQESWIFNDTIQYNIVFKEKLIAERYSQVIEACALKNDIDNFDELDYTVVDSKGYILNETQKVKISLARCIYKEADIYLVDNIFASIDTSTAKLLFEECLQKFLKNKCVLFVSHNTQLLKQCNVLFLMENGSILKQGSYNELRDSGLTYTKHFDDYQDDTTDDEVLMEPQPDALENLQREMELQEVEQPEKFLYNSIYIEFLTIAGTTKFVKSLLLYAVTVLLAHGTDYYLKEWTRLRVTVGVKTPIRDHSQMNRYIRTYTILVILTIIFSLLSFISLFNYCGEIWKRMHTKLFASILYAPIEFFHKNNAEHILKRFASDLLILDLILPLTATNFLKNVFPTVAVIFVVSLTHRYIAILTVIILLIFYMLYFAYMKTREMFNAIESVARHTIHSHFFLYLSGFSTVRAIGSGESLENDFHNHHDIYTSVYWIKIFVGRGFGFWLDLTCVTYSGVAIFLLLYSNDYDTETVGLVSTQLMLLIGSIQWGLKQIDYVESVVTSLKKITTFSVIKPESERSELIIPQSWPYKGRIEFLSVSLKKFESSQYALKEISFKIYENEKIGIYGKSGAGKTALVYALCQLVEIEGLILIDGIDISRISLFNLRSKIQVINQKPLLYYGPLRENLDPFNLCTDEELWKVLEEVQLKPFVASLPLRLSYRLHEDGANLSVGQRQLLCLARAIIQKEKIIIIDEALSNLDPQTESEIQNTMKNAFKYNTLIHISQSFDSIIESDRIMVLDEGRIVEFDSPYLLLSNRNSLLATIMRHTNPTRMQRLMNIAELAYKSKHTNED